MSEIQQSGQPVLDGLEPSQPRRVSMIAKVAIGIVVFVGIAWVLSALRTQEPKKVVQEPSTLATSTIAYASFEPVVDGEFTYTLDGARFVFEPQEPDESGVPSTRIKLELQGLRRNGVPIEVARYRLGTYRGACEDLDPAVYQSSSAQQGALAFASCSYEGAGRQLGVFQEGNNLTVKVRSVSEDGVSAEQMASIIVIPVPKIVTK